MRTLDLFPTPPHGPRRMRREPRLPGAGRLARHLMERLAPLILIGWALAACEDDPTEPIAPAAEATPAAAEVISDVRPSDPSSATMAGRGVPGLQGSRSVGAPSRGAGAEIEKLTASLKRRGLAGAARAATPLASLGVEGASTNAAAAVAAVPTLERYISFDNPDALNNLYDQARNTFARRTKRDASGRLVECRGTRTDQQVVHQTCWGYKEPWGSSHYVEAWPITYDHFHLLFENGSPSTDYANEPRYLSAMTGSAIQPEWHEVTLRENSAGELTLFAMPSIAVRGTQPIQLWYRSEDGSVWGWGYLDAGYNWGVDIKDAYAVWIGTAGPGRFEIENFLIRTVCPPVADAGGPYYEYEGAAIQFSSAGSSAPDGGALDYRWDFGDGTASTEANPKHAYLDDNRAIAYPVTLTVTDHAGAASTARTEANVTDAAPVVKFAATSPTTFRAGGTVSVRGSFTDKGAKDMPWTYTIDWGDRTASTTGTLGVQGTAITASHRYASAGIWYASMTVKDKDNGYGYSAYLKVTVTR